ncbi:MAG: aminotransferase class III-fold pyridoxal phosphate-dependent enzyme, partial [Clostridia bacterium]|nr:aminotransferase class III-fold pyridoxal phosphate-dependent enzyme [Clostridia bacterium]
MNLREKDNKYIASSYSRFPVTLVSGEGALVYDDCGKEYIDLGAGIAVNTFGYSDKKWVEAVTQQISKLSHTSNLYYTEPGAMLAEVLCEKTGFKKVFFSNSGAEANECAIKAARKYSHDKYGDGRYAIVTLVNSFHGRTVTTLAATGQDVFHKDFNPFTGGFIYAKANDIEDTLAKIKENNACAVMLELVQGEGGVMALDKEY